MVVFHTPLPHLDIRSPVKGKRPVQIRNRQEINRKTGKSQELAPFRSLSQTLVTGVRHCHGEQLIELLSTHPDLVALAGLIDVYGRFLDRFNPISVHTNYSMLINTLVKILRRCGREMDPTKVEALFNDYPKIDYASIYDATMRILNMNETARHWIEYNPQLWREIPRFLDSMPNGKAIVVIEDPRAVLLSAKIDRSSDTNDHLRTIFNCYDAMKHANEYRSALPSDRFLIVTTEDLVSNPRGVYEVCCRFLNIPDRPRSFPLPKQIVKTGGSDQERIGLSAEEIALVETVCADPMAEFGYRPIDCSHDWMKTVHLLIGDDRLLMALKNWIIGKSGLEDNNVSYRGLSDTPPDRS